MNIITYAQFLAEIDKLTHKIASSGLRIDAVVPVLRSGMIPAFKIAERLHRPIMIDGVIHGGVRLSKSTQIENILLVDDSINTGYSMSNELQKYVDRFRVNTAAVICSPSARDKVMFHSIQVDQPRVFEWNMMHSNNSSKVMFDLDGVICIDPRVYDDDGEEYKNEISNIPSLFLPSYPIHSIVTNRLEKWRNITERWLEQKNVSYGFLMMQKFDTAEERRRQSNTASYKAEIFKLSDAIIFIESDLSQAEIIAERSGKPVYCIQSNSFVKASPANTEPLKKLKKLEIGPGDSKISSEWVTVGDYARPGVVDHVCKWGHEKLPFDEGTFDQIFASHSLEHIPWWLIDSALSDCYRILRSGGTLELHVPDLEYLIECYTQNRFGDLWKKHNNRDHHVVWLASRIFSYGPTESNFHKSCFDYKYLKMLLARHGFKEIVRLNSGPPFDYHGPINLGVKAAK